jgi:hypothetical protein
MRPIEGLPFNRRMTLVHSTASAAMAKPYRAAYSKKAAGLRGR